MTKELKEMIKNNKFPRECFSKAQCSNMRNIDLIDFMYWYEPTMLIKSRGSVRLKDNVSVVLNGIWCKDFAEDNRYYTAIDFCTKYLGLSTYGAMYVLNEYLKDDHKPTGAIPTPTTPIEEIESDIAKGIYAPANKIKSIYAYLCTTRGIPTETVHRFLDDEALYCEKLEKGYNLLFPIYNDEGKITGFEKSGILTNKEKRYKGCVISQQYTGFTYTYRKIPSSRQNHYYAFESGLDLMSFVALADLGLIVLPEDENIILISLRGLQSKVLQEYTGRYSRITLCVDDDKAGQLFYSNIKKQYYGLNYCNNVLNAYGVKDWNDLLNIRRMITSPIHL